MKKKSVKKSLEKSKIILDAQGWAIGGGKWEGGWCGEMSCVCVCVWGGGGVGVNL